MATIDAKLIFDEIFLCYFNEIDREIKILQRLQDVKLLSDDMRTNKLKTIFRYVNKIKTSHMCASPYAQMLTTQFVQELLSDVRERMKPYFLNRFYDFSNVLLPPVTDTIDLKLMKSRKLRK